ncbi:MAG: alpha/beta hydrolase [Pseudomonadota bacterium]
MTETLTLKDGTEIALERSGAGRPIVFIHGWAMRGRCFEQQQADLQGQFQIVSFDLRGHGGSKSCASPPTIEQLGADVIEVFEQLDLSDAVCVGWSMGAMVAWEALSRRDFASRVAGLVCIDMSPRITNDASWKLGLADGRRPGAALRAIEEMRSDWRRMTERFVPRIFAPENIDRLQSLIDEISDDTRHLDGAVMADLWESMAVQDFRKTLPHMTTPMRAIHGANSQLYPTATGEFIAAEAPHAELSIFEKSGHSPHLEEPERFAAELQNFIQRLEPALNKPRPSLKTAVK